MTLRLCRSDRLPEANQYQYWVSAGELLHQPPSHKRLPHLMAQLEAAFDQIAPLWIKLAHDLNAGTNGDLSGTACAMPNASDLGAMLALDRLIEPWVQSAQQIILICDDPWLYRHFAARAGIHSDSPPHLMRLKLVWGLRGAIARTAFALRCAVHAWRSRNFRQALPSGQTWLLSFAHPSSDRQGNDAYFGDLMVGKPKLLRLLHTQGGLEKARPLLAANTHPAQAWGSALWALTHLPTCRWRPNHDGKPYSWLLRRAEAVEGRGAYAASVAWQIHCQSRWLAQVRPRTLIWPWENQGWERALVKTARQFGTTTCGYQHTVIGRQMLNYSPMSNALPDSLPDRVMTTGAWTRRQLLKWGCPADQTLVGGALRNLAQGHVKWMKDAPVLLALPFATDAAAEMVAAARRLARAGARFLVRPHPMFPFHFTEEAGLALTDLPLGRQPALRSVVFCASTIGLEAILMGIPAYRFRPASRFMLDILPEGLTLPVVEGDTLDQCLTPETPPKFDHTDIFAAPDPVMWGKLTAWDAQ